MRVSAGLVADMNAHQAKAAELAGAISAHHRACGRTWHLAMRPGGAVRVDGYCGHAAERALLARLGQAQERGWPRALR